MAHFELSKKKLHEVYQVVKKMSDLVSFSLKTNREVAHVLFEETDCDFSVHTGELFNDIKDPKRVLFFLQATNTKQLEDFFARGIRKYVVDNEADLKTLLSFLETQEDNITLYLRIKLKEMTIRTGRHFVFGMSAATANEWIAKLKDHKNIASLGIHFHRKSQNISEWNLQEELEHLLPKETLETIDWLNIGGGLPAEYVNSRVQQYDYIFDNIKKLRVWLKQHNVKLVVEPGRFLAAPAITLHTKIIEVYDNNVIVDASVYNAAMDTFIAHVRMKCQQEVSATEGKPYVIKGRTPDSMDIIRYRAYLIDPQVGDELVFENAGAYNFRTEFCGLEKLETKIMD